MRRIGLGLVFGAAAFACQVLLGGSRHSAASEKAAVDPAAVQRARKTARMLDDIYKSAVVLITDKYVRDRKDFPAGRAAVHWFKAISKKGWHEVRIIDVSGEPYSQANVAKDDFDKEGIRRLKAGSDFFDRVETANGKSYLRAITPIPVVMQKCVMCHDHYKTAKKGEPVGALTYKIPLE